MDRRLKNFILNIISALMIFNLLCVSTVMADENGSYIISIGD